MSDPYLYPGTRVLINKAGLRDEAAASQHEAERSFTRMRQILTERLAFPNSADGLRALHRHIFQDVFDWAGKDRTVDLARDNSFFARHTLVAQSLDTAFKEIARTNGFKDHERRSFLDRLGHHLNEINAVHPFREGNGRTLRIHAALVARDACHPLRIHLIDGARWNEASRLGFVSGDHSPLAKVLERASDARTANPNPVSPDGRGPGGSPSQASLLSARFLANSATQNRTDPELRDAQALLDRGIAIYQSAHPDGGRTALLNFARIARQDIAARIAAGKKVALKAKDPTAPGKPGPEPAKAKSPGTRNGPDR